MHPARPWASPSVPVARGRDAPGPSNHFLRKSRRRRTRTPLPPRPGSCHRGPAPALSASVHFLSPAGIHIPARFSYEMSPFVHFVAKPVFLYYPPLRRHLSVSAELVRAHVHAVPRVTLGIPERPTGPVPWASAHLPAVPTPLIDKVQFPKLALSTLTRSPDRRSTFVAAAVL